MLYFNNKGAFEYLPFGNKLVQSDIYKTIINDAYSIHSLIYVICALIFFKRYRLILI